MQGRHRTMKMPKMNSPILSLEIHVEEDVVLTRQRARQLASLLGFDAQDQTRIATAVSEIARNALIHAGGGAVAFFLENTMLHGSSPRAAPPGIFTVRIQDRGAGIAHLPVILEGNHASRAGMGLGITGARRLMERFAIESSPGLGTTVLLGKPLPQTAPRLTGQNLGNIAAALRSHVPHHPLEELRQQNQELLRTLGELRTQQEELTRLNRELEETNRGVVALYAELDEKVGHLLASQILKSRFLSHVSHEFRTPLSSILALTNLLLNWTDGELTSEQTKQITFIRKAAEELTTMVNDQLDLAKVEAGMIVVRPVPFTIGDLFATLRGMLRPLFINDAVTLSFEEPSGLPPLLTDQNKVAQILRNFITNALKFTEYGSICVRARLTSVGDAIVFSVTDTGIGIAPEDHARIFEEFIQVEGSVQRRVNGTGLGLPLSKKLAELLGGHVSVQSQVDVGSTFSAIIPCIFGRSCPVAGGRESDR